jgi:hypothetical protein
VSLRWDDILVFTATILHSIGFGVTIKVLRALYLVEAFNKRLVLPQGFELLDVLDVMKWATVFGTMNWSAIYMVKFAFFYFFHVLIVDMPRHITCYYWISVIFTIVCWIFALLSPFIVCHHFGSDAVQCRMDPNFYPRSLANNLLVICVDIITDFIIISLPLIMVKQALMPLSRKISLASMLCLSVAMIICSAVRLVITVSDTRKGQNGTAPVWAFYWGSVEGCIALMMTSVIAIRGALISLGNDGKNDKDGSLRHLIQNLLASLRFLQYSRRSRSSAGPHHTERQAASSDSLRLPTQALTRATLSGVRRFFSSRHHSSHSEVDFLDSIDTTHGLETLDYHEYQKQQAAQCPV